jgi:RHS repeat-associated protein
LAGAKESLSAAQDALAGVDSNNAAAVAAAQSNVAAAQANVESRQAAYDGRGNVREKAYGDGTKESWEYNGNDQPVTYIDRDGVRTEWSYDGRGNCVWVRIGGVAAFTGVYNAANRLTESREGTRETARYVYDARGYAAGQTVTVDGLSIEERWTNDALGRVVRYEDGAGQVWEYGYEAKRTWEKTPGGLLKEHIYNSRKDLTVVRETDTVSGEARERRIRYDRRHLPVEATDGAGNVTEYVYRADGELTKKKQGPWEWEYAYDAGGRLGSVTRRMEGSGEAYVERYQYAWQGYGEEIRSVLRPGSGGGTENTGYRIDAWGRVKSVTNALGEVSARTLSGAGRTLTEQAASGGFYGYRYDGAGRLAEAGRLGAAAARVTYNADGSVAEKTDRLGTVTRYEYDGRGLLKREAGAAGEKRYLYDGAGRVIREEIITAQGSEGGSGAYYTEWEYAGGGRTVTVTEGGTYRVVWELDGWGETVRKTDGAGNARRWAYDGAGQVTEAVDGYGNSMRYEWNELGKIAKITDAEGRRREYRYNHLGEVIRISDGEGTVWEGGYDGAGRLAWEKGRPGIDRAYKYDALGRIAEVRAGGEVTERYAYTNRGRQVTSYDGNGAAYRYDRNEYGEQVLETNRTGDSQSYLYDAEGRLAEKVSFLGKRTASEYGDGAGRETVLYGDGTVREIIRDYAGNISRVTGETGMIRYWYDAGGRLVRQYDEGCGEETAYWYDAAGRRIRMTSGNRDARYSYGKNGELLSVTDGGLRLKAEYRYDRSGLETARAYGNGVRQETEYDLAGRVVLIRELDSRNGLLRAEGYVYDEQGRRTHSVDAEGKVTKYEYDGQGRLRTALYTWTEEKAEADRKEAEEAGLFFTADKGQPERHTFNGNEITALRAVLNRAGAFRGNAIGAAQTMWRETYGYDANGNRAAKTTPWGTIAYSYDAENRLARKGDIAYTYDRDGNLLSEKGLRREAEYRYSGANRMTWSSVTDHAGRTRTASSYAYDAFGRRTTVRDEGGDSVRTLYDGFTFEAVREGAAFRDGTLTARYSSGAPAANGTAEEGTRYRWLGGEESGGVRTQRIEGDAYTAVTARYAGTGAALYGNGEAVAVSRSAGTNTRGGTAYLGKDIQGSVRSSTSEYGALEERYEYDAFGKPYKGDFTSGVNLGYTGKPYDTVTGLYDYGYRDYQPEVARFTTVDPVRDGSNWFAYVNNDPVNWVDPWGLETTYYYEQHSYFYDSRTEFSLDGTTTYYADSEETVTQHRDNAIDTFINGIGGSYQPSKDDPKNSFEKNEFGVEAKTTFSPVHSAELPSGLPNPPQGNVASLYGTAKDNGFETNCGK